jgi:hypothetical protein
MFIETTFMRYGHAPDGVIEITLKLETLNMWVLSLHTFNVLEADLDKLIENSTESEYSKHNEEGKTRSANDTKDRQYLTAKLELCVNPSNLDTHHGELVNIVTEQHGIEKVNMQNAVLIGVQQMNDFSQKLPHDLHDKIHQNVITLIDSKKHVKVGDSNVYDLNVIFSKVVGL